MSKKVIFIALVGMTVLLTLATRYLLDTDELLVSSLSEKLAENQVEEIVTTKQKWKWVEIAVVPLELLIKISLISGVLYLGTFLFDKKIAYKRLFTIVTKAEFVFVVAALFKLLWFVFQNDYSLEDIQNFYPLSILSVMGYEDVASWFKYLFKTLNLFEVAYLIVLTYLIQKEIRDTTDKAFKIVVSSYGSGLVIWIVSLMFLSLSMA